MAAAADWPASMGPRRWGRGRRGRRSESTPGHWLQWGRDDGVAEDVRPDVELRGRTVSFNGAATMGSRKTRDRASSIAAALPASMGPRRWGRGRRGAAIRGSGPSRLQWGRDDGVAEDGEAAIVGGGSWLQWGRDDGVAEDAATRWRIADAGAASMGPRRWGRGRRRAYGHGATA